MRYLGQLRYVGVNEKARRDYESRIIYFHTLEDLRRLLWPEFVFYNGLSIVLLGCAALMAWMAMDEESAGLWGKIPLAIITGACIIESICILLEALGGMVYAESGKWVNLETGETNIYGTKGWRIPKTK